jgi:serine kinase of HPr protein (carbohydrate metabolism regulator)
MTILVHATTVHLGAHGVMLLGASGAGKTDLALRLIADGALLVSDDQTQLTLAHGRLIASAPATIAGRIEARGIGILPAPQIASAIVRLAVQLSGGEIERMPEPAHWTPLGVASAPHIPLIRLAPFEPCAAVKLRMALLAVTNA